MNKEKQIDAMAKVYEEARLEANETLGSMNEGAEMWYAKAFYNAGYRKASEVAEEIFAEIERKLTLTEVTHCSQKLYYLSLEDDIAELKNKYEVKIDE